MAFDRRGLSLVNGDKAAGKIWKYITLDAAAVVDTAGYFDNGATTNTRMRNVMKVGDSIIVCVVTGAINNPTGVTTWGWHVVTEITAAGIIDVNDAILLQSATDTD